MFPTHDQRKELHKFFAAARYCYNWAVDLLNNGEPANLISLRKVTSSNDSIDARGPKMRWILEVPSRVRAHAVHDAVTAIKSAFTNKKNGNIKKFKLGFRSFLKSPTESIGVEKPNVLRTKLQTLSTPRRGVKHGVLLWAEKSPLGPIAIKDRRRVIGHLKEHGFQCDSKVHWEKTTGRFYLLVPHDVVPNHPAVEPLPLRVASLDPGVRDFNAYYSPNGENGVLLDGEMTERFHPLCRRIDKVRSARDTLKAANHITAATRKEKRCRRRVRNRRSRRLRRREAKLWAKIDNRRVAAHYAAVNYLWEKFDTVMIPEFQTAKMVTKEKLPSDKKRAMGRKSVRDCLTWGHYLFRQRLLSSRIHGNSHRQVLITPEGYTSKTCGWCGYLHHNLDSAKTFCCPQCHIVMDRDVNGARNIMLRAVYHGPVTLPPPIAGDCVRVAA